MTYYHVVTADSYGYRVNTVPANDAKDAIRVLLRDRHVIGREPLCLGMSVYEKRADDSHYDGRHTTMERRLAASLKESGAVLADCNVTIVPQKIIVEDITNRPGVPGQADAGRQTA